MMTPAHGRCRPWPTSAPTRPSSIAPSFSLEVHILDFAADLYDKRLRVELVERLRGEQRFAGIDALLAQIRADIEQARALLATPAPGGDRPGP